MHDGQIATIGKFTFSTDLGECKIMMYGSDQDTAYFCVNTKYGDTKLKLLYPEYYGDNQPYYLNEVEKKELYDYLNQSNSNGCSIDKFGESIFKKLQVTWEIFNDPYSNYPEKDNLYDYELPDYRRLEK